MHLSFRFPGAAAVAAALAFGLAACAEFPSTGPDRRAVDAVGGQQVADLPPIALVDINQAVVQRLVSGELRDSFAASFGGEGAVSPVVGVGDLLEVSLWEAPPATLFVPANLDAHVSNTAGMVTLPSQMVDRDGVVRVPFIGLVTVVGKSTSQVADEIVRRLKDKANQPQVVVRMVQNASSTVSILGETATNLRMPLSAGGERLLDALAAAGGSRQPVTGSTLQLTRGTVQRSMPLDQVIRDPRQNVALRPGDVVTVLSHPYTYTVLGATGKQSDTPMEAQGITLAQALGRSGGLLDSRADPNGIFVFRMERPANLPEGQVAASPSLTGRVPVVYRLDLRDPKSFFAMQDFPIRDRDIVYVSNAPSTDLQKFLNLVFTINRQVVYTFDTAP
jgi:polysaccharide export outer membrane protein